MTDSSKIKTRAEFLEKFPKASEKINKVFDKLEDMECPECQKKGLFTKLQLDFGILTEEQIKAELSRRVFTSVNSPRESCEDCYKEHIAKAIHNLTESLIGEAYPKHRWLAIGNLGEASAEILGINSSLASEIRDIKKQMIKDKTFIPDLMKYL